MKITLKHASLWLALLLFSQCKVFDNEVVVPGYVYIPDYRFETNADGSQGDSTSKFTEVWVYSAGNLEGAFALPALIPIQRTGSFELSIDAGIQKSGQFYERLPYQLLNREYFNVNLSPNQIDTIRPVFRYSAGNKFVMVEDFDNIGFRFTRQYTSVNDTIIRVNNGDSARTPGKNSGMIVLDDSTTYFRMVTTDGYRLLGGNNPTVLELDYNTDVILYIGIAANGPGGVDMIPLYYAFPSKGWNKAYVDLSADIAKYPLNTEYKIYIDIRRDLGSPKPKIILDNIKLIEG